MIRELKKPFTYDKIKLDPSQNKKGSREKDRMESSGRDSVSFMDICFKKAYPILPGYFHGGSKFSPWFTWSVLNWYDDR